MLKTFTTAATEYWDIKLLDTARKVHYLTDVEKDVVLETNKARSDPRKYAQLYIEPMLQYYNGNRYEKPGEIVYITKEGRAAAEECVTVLSNMVGVGLLIPELGLSKAAKDHVNDQGQTENTGHTGEDGSDVWDRPERYGQFGGAGIYSWSVGENIQYGKNIAREIVIQLLIDDGVADRGHRVNIMNDNFSQIGTAVGSHKKYRNMCVIVYSHGYTSN